MAGAVQHGVDGEQVKKATKALLAYCKTKENANSLLLNEHEWISVMLTVWRIPNQEKTIKIPLPHGIRPDTCDVCLITRDEPNMSIEQTEKFYKKLLSQHGVTQISEVIPLKKIKKEYKPYEAKRRLLSSFDLFLADDRIRRFLPSHIGKHFYKQKREPQSVNLKSKNLAAVLNRHIQGTLLHITNKGCCYSMRVGHIGMKVNDIVENTLEVAKVLAEKLPKKWKNVKVLHLKTQTSVALPIYTSSFDSLKELSLVKEVKDKTKKKKSDKENKPAIADSGDHIADEMKVTATPKKNNEPEGEEEIPNLIPIEEPASAKKNKKKKKVVQEESNMKENCKESEENVKVSSTVKPTPKKRKTNESDVEIKTPSKHKKQVPTEKKSEEPETPLKHSIRKKTPKKTPGKSAVKLTKSARKAPQTPKLKQKKKMKTPQSV
ncbi:ribosomal L1 domain-containing protein 1 [Hyla sarda]|uniref:ribosomal L1 domain-containing protein 1 n=1 Tax=Hyla sarda TaxID=327740 RepID=UPI0024C4043E|nr:ribosomal L1 domain-containing protein 1 [Hyla sarda]